MAMTTNLIQARPRSTAVAGHARGGNALVRWVGKNLFNGWVSTLLTVVSVLAIGWLVAAVGPWLRNSIWSAGSLMECRSILDGASGACWGVIRDRWAQLLFGFYPSTLYWRPVTAFGLLLVALAPMLFPGLPRKILRFSALYPGLAFWLIWGGSFWFPVTIYIGLLIGISLFSRFSRKHLWLAAGIGMAGSICWWVFLSEPAFLWAESLVPTSVQAITSRQIGGFLLSVIIGVTGIVLSLPLGILLALGRRSSLPFIHATSVIFIEFIRGVPLITILFSASLLLNYFLPPGSNFDLILRVVIMVTLFASAYMAEVIRGGLAALPRGQYEAAEALGLDYWRTQRLVIMPQALKISIPGIVNSFIGLFKDTTLVVFIGLLDPVAIAAAIRAHTDWQGIYWELYIFIGAIFFLFCFGMSRYSMYLERRLKTDHR